MASSIVAATLLVFIYALQNSQISNLHALVFAITIAYFYRYCAINNFSLQQTMKYILYGQGLYALLYLVWLTTFHKFTYVFYVPLFFSTIAKLAWLFTSKEKLNIDFLEQSSLFQTKTQIFVIGYELLSIPYGGIPILVQIFALILLMKFKYSFHQKAQQAFKQLHFIIDNIFKRTKIRPKYQKLVQILGLAGEVYGGSKEIIY